jgi:hypothetical protein
MTRKESIRHVSISAFNASARALTFKGGFLMFVGVFGQYMVPGVFLLLGKGVNVLFDAGARNPQPAASNADRSVATQRHLLCI